jgi:hypothetical protein|tara:strand:- start:1590 stop:1847 length:258 start_codon:yes stop_codon:yes gene_type:complete
MNTSKMKKADSILSQVLIDHIKRHEAGQKKYGGSMDDNHKPVVAWIKDAKEEAMDFVVYLTKLEKLLTGDNTSDKLMYDSEKIRK